MNRERGHRVKGSEILLESGTNEVEFLEFTVGGEHYGVNVGKVCQALVWDEESLTELPGSPPEVLGTVYFRGKPISVIDLKRYLGMSDSSEPVDKPLLLVVEFNKITIGFIIDGIEGIERISWNEFVPVERAPILSNSSSITGTFTVGDRIILILDFEAMMAEIEPNTSVVRCSENMDAGSGALDREGLKILYCEDSPLVRKVTSKTLQEAGFKNIKICTTGAEGFQYLCMNADEVDLILSDIEMPEMDGLAFCKKVKSDPALSKIPFIFFSSMINEQMERKCESVGADASLSKPDINEIVGAIEKLCSPK